MSLQSQIVDLVLTEGIKQKIDNKLTLKTQLLALQNRVFKKSGVLDKRNGFDNLSNQDSYNNFIMNMEALSVFDSRELMMFANGYLYSYSPATGRWIPKDPALSASVELTSVANSSFEHTMIDMCVSGSVAVYVWKDSATDYLYYSIQDIESGSLFVSRELLTTTGTRPRCCTISGINFIFFADGIELKYIFISPADPVFTVGSGTISLGFEDLGPEGIFDVVAFDQ